jgi:TIR domain
MKIFISWSGEQSKRIAEILKKWIPGVIQAVKPYYSPDDIAKGTRWNSEVGKELEASKIGIICLTQDNLQAPWIMFEAGALSKNIDKSKVCPLLFGVEPTDIQGPLIQFQAAKFEKDEIHKVIKMINAELGESKLASEVLDSVFEMWWPKLKEWIEVELSANAKSNSPSARSEREILEEILQLTRSMAKNHRSDLASLSKVLTNRSKIMNEDYLNLLIDTDDIKRKIYHYIDLDKCNNMNRSRSAELIEKLLEAEGKKQEAKTTTDEKADDS